MDKESWISLLTSKILKKSCEVQNRREEKRGQKWNICGTAASLYLYTIINQINKDVKIICVFT